MNRLRKDRFLMLFCLALLSLFVLAGCGEDGAQGPAGPAGAPGTVTPTAKAETCTLCHANDPNYAPADIHPNAPASVAALPTYVATIDSVSVASSGGTTTFTINFTVKDGSGAYIPTLGDRVAPDATGAQQDRLAYLRFGYAKLITNPSVTGETRWVSYNQGERTYTRLTSYGSGTYTYVCSALTATTGVTVYDPAARTRIGLQIGNIAGGSFRPLQITQDFVPNNLPSFGGPFPATREIVTTAACAECHGTQNGIAHGTRYNADWCAVCHTRETTRNGETVEFKSMVHQIHTSQTRSFLDAAEVTYPQEILHCAKCHKGGVDSDNWRNMPSIEACNSCHYVYFGNPTDPLPAGYTAKHSGGQATNADCTTCHFAGATTKKDPAVAHVTQNATTHNPNVPAGDVNFKYEIALVTASSTTTLTSVSPKIKFRILASEPTSTVVPPFTPVTFATYTTNATMLTVGTHTFSGSPSFLVAYALPQEGLANSASVLNDYNNLGKAAAQPASVSITNLWNGTSGSITGPDGSGYYTATITSSSGKFPAGARLRAVALQGYFTQVDTGHARHTVSVVGSVTGDVVRRVVVDPAKCANCHEWFEGHGGNRVYETQVCVVCHVPNLSSSGRGADPATVLARIAIGDPTGATPAKMTAAGYNPADPSTYPEENQNFKDLIHAAHASGMRVQPFRFVRDRGASGVYYYDFSEITFPGRIGDCETCHKPNTYNLPTIDGLLSSTYETTDGNAATSVTTDRSGTSLPNANDLVTPPSTAACVTCHDGNTSKTHMGAQGGSFKVKRSDAVR